MTRIFLEWRKTCSALTSPSSRSTLDSTGWPRRLDDAKLIVLGTSQVPARQRFTLAHELGHLLAGDDQGVHLDRDIFDRAQAKDPSEMRANSFASAFLMPEDLLRAAVGPDGLTEQGFAALACDLKVTPSALAFRLRDLRLIDSGPATGTSRSPRPRPQRSPDVARNWPSGWLWPTHRVRRGC